jgi:hypothetical protein
MTGGHPTGILDDHGPVPTARMLPGNSPGHGPFHIAAAFGRGWRGRTCQESGLPADFMGQLTRPPSTADR